ncbi:unnamed protein product [Euphydryas editha]|uniref:Uncharacterized protein n=1 Tax=Euphydryas editha TaxID=104508 RepID=A0AAU9U4M9_EUPED|nr:unnamed protein product [Euphydryas editha]
MDFNKQYIYKLRNVSLAEPYIILNDDVAPKLNNYIRLLDEIAFEDGSYHIYYGEIKTILNSFIEHWTQMMDEAIKEADRCSNTITKEALMKMMEKTILIHQMKQVDFEQQFLPAENSFEKEIFNNLKEKFESFMEQLLIMRDDLKKLDKQTKVEAFAKEHFPISLKRKNDIFIFTYYFISEQLTFVIDRIHISLKEILTRVRNNVRTMEERSEVNISRLLIRLYEKNKEHLMLSRQDIRSSADIAEVQRSMEIIKDKIEDSKHVPYKRLQEEFEYWDTKMYEFEQINKTLKKIQAEEKKVLEQEKLFNSLKDTEIPAPKRKCWENMGERFKQKLEELRELKSNAAKTLLTFFSVRGADRIEYSDNIGKYFVDDYGHQRYIFDYGLKELHVNCDGDFVEKPDKQRYFYDNMGRFIIDDNGQKLYQLAPCTSTYRIENDIFVKESKDCGHSEQVKNECRMQIKNPTDEQVLPDKKPIDIKGKLDAEVVKYLWDTFGHVLPEILYDVSETRPKNPIHYIARRLIALKFKKNENDLVKMKREASEYRENIHKDRTEKMKQKLDAWKAKQVKRRKPEESDDTEERFVYDAHVLQQDFIRSLENYNV